MMSDGPPKRRLAGVIRASRLPAIMIGLLMSFSHAETIPIGEIKQLTFVPNPDGVQVGFWANYKFSKEVLEDFGLRPIERVNFHKWAQIEKKPAEFQWGDCFRSEKQAHLAGSTVIGNVNTFFSRRLNAEGMDAIPDFYEQDIRNPAAREAARRFLAAFTTRMLDEIGESWLLLDYEFLWFALPRTPEVRQAYRDWFLEAAALCRETARTLGKEHLLKIGCCLDSNPLDTARHLIGSDARPPHPPQDWLLDVIGVSDFVTVDAYAQTSGKPASPRAFLDGLKFWIDHYAGDKPVFVTENGFSTAPEYGLTETGYHARGTEAEQAEFFHNVLSAFENRNSPELEFLNKVRGYCIWMYRDMDSAKNSLEDHFGIVRKDGSRKPAWQIIKSGIEAIERNPALAPVKLASAKSLAPDEMNSNGVQLTYRSGTEHQALQISFQTTAEASGVDLIVVTGTPSCVIAHLEGRGWLSSLPRQGRTQTLRLSPLPGAKGQTVTLYFTAEKLPVTTVLEAIELRAAK